LRLLDTDTCTAILRGNAGVIERRTATPDDVATLCAWTEAERARLGVAAAQRD